jgi:hypothetical protein
MEKMFAKKLLQKLAKFSVSDSVKSRFSVRVMNLLKTMDKNKIKLKKVSARKTKTGLWQQLLTPPSCKSVVAGSTRILTRRRKKGTQNKSSPRLT